MTRNVIRAGWVLIAAYLALGVYRLWSPPASLTDLGNRNVLACILLLILPFGDRIKTRRLWWLWFVAGTAAMVATRSRGGLLGLLMAVGVLWRVDKRLIIGAGVVSLPVLFVWKKASAMNATSGAMMWSITGTGGESRLFIILVRRWDNLGFQVASYKFRVLNLKLKTQNGGGNNVSDRYAVNLVTITYSKLETQNHR